VVAPHFFPGNEIDEGGRSEMGKVDLGPYLREKDDINPSA
jgi:hypothetical protein